MKRPNHSNSTTRYEVLAETTLRVSAMTAPVSRRAARIQPTAKERQR